jgi:hypothetical protein
LVFGYSSTRYEEGLMDDLRVESAAHVLISRALPNSLAVYRSLLEALPCDCPLDDQEAAAVGGAVLLYGLYCRLLELEGGLDPEAAMERAFQALTPAVGHDPALIASLRDRYDGMHAYKVFRPNVTILQFIAERAWHVAYPEHQMDEESAFQGFVQSLVEDSYGKLHSANRSLPDSVGTSEQSPPLFGRCQPLPLAAPVAEVDGGLHRRLALDGHGGALGEVIDSEALPAPHRSAKKAPA